MGFGEFMFVFHDIPALFSRNDDDIYDRLSHRWTVGIILVFTLVVSTTQYVGDPVHCWVPAHFHGSWEKYTNNYCWVRNTYYLPWEETIDRDLEARYKQTLVYYQWVPLILMAQALFFFLPVVIWRGMNDQTGMDMHDVIESCEKYQAARDVDAKTKLLGFITKQTHRYLKCSKKANFSNNKLVTYIKTSICCCICGKKFGNYITLIYILIKLLFLANVLGQLWVLNSVLGMNYSSYGVDVIRSASEGVDWTDSHRFPRATLCDVEVRRLGNNNRYTVQCVLTVNLFNEKIYLFLWFWFCLVAVITAFGLILNIMRAVFTFDRERYIEKHITLGTKKDVYNTNDPRDRRLLKDFVHNYLRRDGVLLMRLVGHNTCKIVVVDLVCALWTKFKEDHEEDARDDEFNPVHAPYSGLDDVDSKPLKPV